MTLTLGARSVVCLVALAVLSGCSLLEPEPMGAPASAPTTARPSSAVAGIAESADPSPPPSATPVERQGDDRSLARAGVLRIKDLPDGFTRVRAWVDPRPLGKRPEAREAARCIGVDPARYFDQETAMAGSDALMTARGDGAQSVVAVYADEAGAIEQFRLNTWFGVGPCLAESFAASARQEITKAQPGVSIGEVGVVRSALRDVGDDVAGYRITLPLTAPGMPEGALSITYDQVFVRVGRAIDVVTLSRVTGSQLRDQDVDDVAETAAERLRAALYVS